MRAPLPRSCAPGGYEAVDLVFRVSRRLAAADVDRACVGGSLGRRTAVRGSWDVDLVLLINGREPIDRCETKVALLAAGHVLNSPAALDPGRDCTPVWPSWAARWWHSTSRPGATPGSLSRPRDPSLAQSAHPA